MKTALAGVLLLQAYSFAPEPHAGGSLTPEALSRAILSRNSVLLEHCFAEQVDVNAVAADGRRPLLLATSQGDRALVERLLAAGADVDAADNNGITPIMIAAAHGRTDLLELLAARSMRIDALDVRGQSAAHHAFAAQQLEAAEILVPLMPSMQVPGADGRDLVALACDSGDPKLITAVLSRVTAPLAWTPHSRAALTTALSSDNAELLRLLLSTHGSPPTVEGRAIPLLAHAIVTADEQTFEKLLAAGADPNTVVPPGADKQLLTTLGSSGIRDYLKADDGVTVLMLAAACGKPEYVRALLAAHADKNRMTMRYKMLALYFAARTDKWRAVQMLLGGGATPEKLRIQISLASQRAAVIKDGAPIFQTTCSTGRAGYSTPAGQYVITDKQRSHKSTIYHVEMPFFMRLNCRDFGMHEGVVPNYPASHGCIRLPSAAAQKLFSEIPVGTVVMIN